MLVWEVFQPNRKTARVPFAAYDNTQFTMLLLDMDGLHKSLHTKLPMPFDTDHAMAPTLVACMQRSPAHRPTMAAVALRTAPKEASAPGGGSGEGVASAGKAAAEAPAKPTAVHAAGNQLALQTGSEGGNGHVGIQDSLNPVLTELGGDPEKPIMLAKVRVRPTHHPVHRTSRSLRSTSWCAYANRHPG